MNFNIEMNVLVLYYILYSYNFKVHKLCQLEFGYIGKDFLDSIVLGAMMQGKQGDN